MSGPTQSAGDSDQRLSRVKNVYSFWGRFSRLYAAQDAVTFLGRARSIRKRAVEKMRLGKGDVALEVACGTGRNFAYIEDQVGRDGRLVGVDYSREMLAAAETSCGRHGWENVSLIEGDAAELHVGDGRFDGIVSVLGISAIPRWEQALMRCKDALRHGGRLVVCDAHLFRGVFRLLNPAVSFVYRRLAAWDPSKRIPEKMQELFGDVEVEWHNRGTIFIATSVKK